MPTDTIYGLVGRAFSKKAVERIYKIKKRNKNKPFIILVSSVEDIGMFGVSLSEETYLLLKKIFPAKVSVILPCDNRKFAYLHRGKKSLAFRVPKNLRLRRLIKKTGPLVAPSANPEGMILADTIQKAKEYFGDKVDFYFDAGKIREKPSVIIEIKRQ